jgi:hypothetical protein
LGNPRKSETASRQSLFSASIQSQEFQLFRGLNYIYHAVHFSSSVDFTIFIMQSISAVPWTSIHLSCSPFQLFRGLHYIYHAVHFSCSVDFTIFIMQSILAVLWTSLYLSCSPF